MKNIADRYRPYNFSSSRCHVIELIISEYYVTRIEVKLPVYIKTVTGVYVTCKVETNKKEAGQINIFFNEGSDKAVSLPVLNTNAIKHNSHPVPLNVEVKPNSTIQGFYLNHLEDVKDAGFGLYKLKIYLHYKY